MISITMLALPGLHLHLVSLLYKIMFTSGSIHSTKDSCFIVRLHWLWLDAVTSRRSEETSHTFTCLAFTHERPNIPYTNSSLLKKRFYFFIWIWKLRWAKNALTILTVKLQRESVWFESGFRRKSFQSAWLCMKVLHQSALFVCVWMDYIGGLYYNGLQVCTFTHSMVKCST